MALRAITSELEDFEAISEEVRPSDQSNDSMKACVANCQTFLKPFAKAASSPAPPSRETRSDPAVKAFTRYRRALGVDERPNGKSKSNIDFHSFRRWFMRKARNAMLEGVRKFDEWTMVAVVGHTDSDRPKSLDLSQLGYAGEDAEKAKRALVEAVRLPD